MGRTKHVVCRHYRCVAETLTFGKTVAFLISKKRTPHLGAGFLLLRGHKHRGDAIGPRLTLSSRQKRTHPKICSEKARIKLQTLAALIFGTTA